MFEYAARANRPIFDLFANRFWCIGKGVGRTAPPVIQAPSSFLVTAGAFRTFMQENRLAEVVEGILEGVNLQWIEEIHRPAAQIKEIIHSAPIPEPLYSGIVEGYQGLGGGAKFIWPATPPANIYNCTREFTQSSYLEVTGLEETFEAVKWWWASIFDANLIFHRELNGQGHGDAGITVVADSCWPPSIEPCRF